MTLIGKHKKELKKVYKNEKDVNDYMDFMIDKRWWVMKTFKDLYNSLWANIHKKRQRIKQGSGERMRKKGENEKK